MEEKLNQLSFANAALFGLLIAAGYYVMFFHPSNPQNQLESMEQEMVTIKGEIAKLDRKIKEGQKLNQEILLMQKKADKVYSQMPEKISVESASSVISQEARTVGLSIQAIEAQGNWNKLKTVAVVDIEATVGGSFGQIMIFLSELTRNNKVYAVREISIVNGEGAKGLSLNATISAYRRLALDEIKTTEAEDEDY